jgi:hypothetical protein
MRGNDHVTTTGPGRLVNHLPELIQSSGCRNLTTAPESAEAARRSASEGLRIGLAMRARARRLNDFWTVMSGPLDYPDLAIHARDARLPSRLVA